MPSPHIERNAPARTMAGLHRSSRLTFLHIARPTMARRNSHSVAIFCNISAPTMARAFERLAAIKVHSPAPISCADSSDRAGLCIGQAYGSHRPGLWLPLIRPAYVTDKLRLWYACTCDNLRLAHSTAVLLCVYAHRRIVVHLYYSTPVLKFLYAGRRIKEFPPLIRP